MPLVIINGEEAIFEQGDLVRGEVMANEDQYSDVGRYQPGFFLPNSITAHLIRLYQGLNVF